MIKGVNKLSKTLAEYERETLQEIKEIVSDNGSELLNRAQQSLNSYIPDEGSGDIENLNFINLVIVSKDNGYSISVGVPGVGSSKESHLAAYVEFGTGFSARETLAKYPEEIRELANEYFVNGQGVLNSHPYLFNNYYVVRDNFIKELNGYLKERSK